MGIVNGALDSFSSTHIKGECFRQLGIKEKNDGGGDGTGGGDDDGGGFPDKLEQPIDFVWHVDGRYMSDDGFLGK